MKYSICMLCHMLCAQIYNVSKGRISVFFIKVSLVNKLGLRLDSNEFDSVFYVTLISRLMNILLSSLIRKILVGDDFLFLSIESQLNQEDIALKYFEKIMKAPSPVAHPLSFEYWFAFTSNMCLLRFFRDLTRIFNTNICQR